MYLYYTKCFILHEQIKINAFLYLVFKEAFFDEEL